MMRELAEMTYQWEVDFEVDDQKFRRTFGYGATPIEAQVDAIATWARAELHRPAPSPMRRIGA